MISITRTPCAMSDSGFMAWLAIQGFTVAFNRDIPTSMFHPLSAQPHGLIVMHVPQSEGRRDDSPIGFEFVRGKPVLSRFTVAVSAPVSIETDGSIPAHQDVLIED